MIDKIIYIPLKIELLYISYYKIFTNNINNE